jgi:hypothetical protein
MPVSSAGDGHQSQSRYPGSKGPTLGYPYKGLYHQIYNPRIQKTEVRRQNFVKR